MKIKILRNYKDLVLTRLVNAGEVLTVTDERGMALINNPSHIAELIEDTKYNTAPPLKTPEEFKKETKEEEKEVTPIKPVTIRKSKAKK